jgi:hypothetical protein
MKWKLILMVALAIAPVSEAGVVSFASTHTGENEWTTTGTTYSHTEATSGQSIVAPLFGGSSHTTPPLPACGFPCISAITGIWESGAASIDATTGKGRAHAAVSTAGVPWSGGLDGGKTDAGFTLTDRIVVDGSVPLMVDLNISFSAFANVAPYGANDFAVHEATYNLAFIDWLSGSRYEIRFQAGRTLDAGVFHSLYHITAGWEGDPPNVIATSTIIPSTLSLSLPAPLVPGIINIFDIELSLLVTASCQVLGPADCTSLLSSPNSSHIGLTGSYTSENGYGYVGLADQTAVPEPSTVLMTGVAFVIASLARRRFR